MTLRNLLPRLEVEIGFKSRRKPFVKFNLIIHGVESYSPEKIQDNFKLGKVFER